MSESITERTSVISVCFNSSAVLEDFLASIPPGTSTILVDNGSTDLASTKALAKVHHARLITNPNNLGFGAACNQGAALSKNEFLFFVNPDSILNTTTIAQLEIAADTHPEASAFNPHIVSKDGKTTFKRRSCLLTKNQTMPRQLPNCNINVPILSGAGLFLRKQVFDQIGGFDEKIFLYHEDDDISLRLREHIGPTWLIHKSQMMHLSGHSSGRSAEISALKAWHMGRSLVYATTKHQIEGAYRKAVWSAFMQFFSPATLISKRKFYKNRAFLQGVLSARKDRGAGYLKAP